MPSIALGILLIVVVLVGTSIYLGRRRKALQEELGIEIPTKFRDRRASKLGAEPVHEEVTTRPEVVDFHVEGDSAKVTFNVPLPEGEDDILSDLLLGEAIEVVREKRHTLPLSGITEVIALAGRGERREVGRAKLDQPGTLPPKVRGVNILNLSVLANDPLVGSFALSTEPEVVPGTVAHARPDELGPLSADLRLPRAVDTGLRAQGIDPSTVSPGELVIGILRLFGYQVSPAGLSGWFASKGGERTYIVEERYKPGDHPEIDDAVIRRFFVEFGSAGTQRGMLITDKYGPFEIYDLERREPRIRFITRDRIQKMIDSLALS
jgi:hypothetical protein